MNKRVLLVEDDASIALVITAALEAEGFAVDRCDSISGRDRFLARNRYHLLLTDVMLTDGDGIETLGRVRESDPALPIIILSAQNTLDTAVRASDTGAFEYFPKPFDLEELIRTVTQAIGKAEAAEVDVSEDVTQGLPLVGRSAAMQAVYRMITRVLRNDLTVLILGESGTGKELVAEAIHQLGNRRSGPFIAVNTAAIPAELIESELFGHERAHSPERSRVRSANSNRPTAAPCSSTRSATCRWRRRPGSCALFNRARSAASAGVTRSSLIAGSSLRPIAIYCQ